MEAGLQRRGSSKLGSAFVLVFAALLLLRARPLVGAYVEKLLSRLSGATLAAAAALAVGAFALTWAGVAKRPRTTAAILSAIAGSMVVLSGNGVAALSASAILLATLLAGDAAFRLLRGAEAVRGDLSAAFASGLAILGTAVLLLGETGGLGLGTLSVFVVALGLLRRRRIPALARLLRESVRLPRGDAPAVLEAAWLAFAALVLLAVWAGVQAPDVSWDGLAYHLPEARDVAVAGRVRPLPDLHPQSLLWRGHDAYLSLAFFVGDERIVPFLQWAAGLGVFGAALSLAKRVGAGGAAALVVLALAAFPTAMLQLKSAYVDWPAALLATAAAAQVAAAPGDRGRMRVAGFLFGAALATKVFALFAAPALAALAWRARPRPMRLAAAALCALLPLGPWLAWSERRAGSVLAPYANSPRELASRIARGDFFTTSPASGAPRPGSPADRVAAFAWLPYDLVFHSSRFEANGDGYNGILVLLLVAGLAGWGTKRIGLFLAVTLPFLIPWSLLYLPSIRYLFPVYPLFAVFTAEGLRRLTGRFSGAAGVAAGMAVLAAAAAFPVQLGSSGLEWKAAFGRMSRQDVLAARLPSLPLQSRLGPSDRVVFLGENDRFHCPAGARLEGRLSPRGRLGVGSGGLEKGARRSGHHARSSCARTASGSPRRSHRSPTWCNWPAPIATLSSTASTC